MKTHWLATKERFEHFLPRERLLIVGAFVALVYLLWDFILVQPVHKTDKVWLAKERNAMQTIKTSEAELTVLSGVAKRDPSLVIKAEIELLEQKLAKMDVELAELSMGLIPSAQLPIMLHDVLKSNQKLKLVNLQTLPAEAILLASNAAVAPEDAGQGDDIGSMDIHLFRHGVKLYFRGNYADSVSYLKALEQSQWTFYWDQFSYSVTEYPNADVMLTVFTLSSDRGVFDGQ